MTRLSEELGLHMSPKHLSSSVEFTGDGAEIVVVAKLGEKLDTLQIFDYLMEAMSKLKENLTAMPDRKWTISFDVGPTYEYGCSFSATTGQPADTQKDTPTGAKDEESSPPWE